MPGGAGYGAGWNHQRDDAEDGDEAPVRVPRSSMIHVGSPLVVVAGHSRSTTAYLFVPPPLYKQNSRSAATGASCGGIRFNGTDQPDRSAGLLLGGHGTMIPLCYEGIFHCIGILDRSQYYFCMILVRGMTMPAPSSADPLSAGRSEPWRAGLRFVFQANLRYNRDMMEGARRNRFGPGRLWGSSVRSQPACLESGRHS